MGETTELTQGKGLYFNQLSEEVSDYEKTTRTS